MCYTGRCKHEDRNGECNLIGHYDCPDEQVDIVICDCCGKDFATVDDETTCGICKARQPEEYLFIIEDEL
jgi:hypothetical protein